MKKKLKKRFGSVWVKTSLLAGLLLVLVSFLIYKFIEIEFWVRAWEEVFGVGMALIALGIIFVFTGRRFN